MRIVRFLRRKLGEAEIWVSLAVAWVLVRFVPFNWWRKSIGPIGGEGMAALRVDEAATRRAYGLGRAVERIADRAWFAPVCLPRAIAARWMLNRRGIPSRIVFGSRRNDDPAGRKLLFHAWLKVADVVVTGAQGHHAFVPFEKRSTEDSSDNSPGQDGPERELPDAIATRKF
tara:strand:+ start:1373 stop:1888 length:516 start_codon:yes stop_codon:yes gene_type:complete